MNPAVDGIEFLQSLHAAKLQHRQFRPSRWFVRIFWRLLIQKSDR
jgi:hypothetical protein